MDNFWKPHASLREMASISVLSPDTGMSTVLVIAYVQSLTTSGDIACNLRYRNIAL